MAQAGGRTSGERPCDGMKWDGMGGKLPSTRIDRSCEYKRERIARPAATNPISSSPIIIPLLQAMGEQLISSRSSSGTTSARQRGKSFKRR